MERFVLQLAIVQDLCASLDDTCLQQTVYVDREFFAPATAKRKFSQRNRPVVRMSDLPDVQVRSCECFQRRIHLRAQR